MAQTVAPPEQVYIPAEPISRTPPDYPLDGLKEGWVLVSFIISEEGKVIEPMIEESSDSIFDAPTLRAIKTWRYKPATLDGKPVEQSMVQTNISYRLQGANGARPRFIDKYRRAYPLIAAKSFAEANQLVEALEKGQLNFYETAWLAWLKYYYLDATGTADPDTLIAWLRKALGSSGVPTDDYLQPDVLVSASQHLFVMEARRGDLSEAVMAYKRLEASTVAKRSKAYKDVMASLEPSYREIMNLVAGPKIIQQTARVGEHNYWVHRMLRRSFAFGDVQGGKLDVVDVRCTRANRRFVSMPENTILKIPDSWGECGVYIKGDEGATFAFEEYPAGYARAADPAEVAPAKQ
ncbi:MAG TPA: energy transducer TonB [Gammaproteobacteria bacterium]|nr:energy transducer TonB [Gammaproteobacteria bacterium]